MTNSTEIKEMEDYINSKIKDKAKAGAKDFAVAVFEYAMKEAGYINITITKAEIDTLIAYDEESVDVIVNAIVKEYGININCEQIGAIAGEVYDIVGTVKEIASKAADLYKKCVDFYVEGTIEAGSECMVELFGVVSAISSAVGGPIASIISEQFSLGADLLERGTELAFEYNQRYEMLDRFLDEIEEDGIVDMEEQKVVNGMMNQYQYSNLRSTYVQTQIYAAFKDKFNWLFEGTATKSEKAQFEKIDEIMDEVKLPSENFMLNYNHLFNYRMSYDYINNPEKANLEVIPRPEKLDDSENTNKKDPLVLDLNNDGQYSTTMVYGTHFDYEGDGFAEKTA